MTGERVPARFLEAGDVIRVRHHHDLRCGQCLVHWQTDAVVTEKPVPRFGRLTVNWAGDARLPSSRPATSGVSVFRLDDHVLRIGRIPVRSTRHWH
jgi:hypothetical protein